jgi:hypothetical protein
MGCIPTDPPFLAKILYQNPVLHAGSGFGSWRPKNVRILLIRIPNTAWPVDFLVLTLCANDSSSPGTFRRCVGRRARWRPPSWCCHSRRRRAWRSRTGTGSCSPAPVGWHRAGWQYTRFRVSFSNNTPQQELFPTVTGQCCAFFFFSSVANVSWFSVFWIAYWNFH